LANDRDGAVARKAMTAIPRRALKHHFSSLNAHAIPLDEALLALLPAELADQSLRALRSTAFLTVPGLMRWMDLCATIAARPSCHPSLRMIDVGCGGGLVGRYLAKTVEGDVVGIDMAESAMRLSHPESGSAAQFVCADVARLPFAAASFDVALAIGFAVEDWIDVTQEWKRTMTAKHRRRWDERDRLIDMFGPPALATCQVSERMLGEDGRPGFIDTNARWEFVASTR
jgi:SAM-dependent methyltransferase